jgi:hypothetical protein
MRILPDANQTAGAIYRIVPELTVRDTAAHVLTFDTLKQTLAYASASQISCYGLSGDAVVPSNQIDHGPDAHSWC